MGSGTPSAGWGELAQSGSLLFGISLGFFAPTWVGKGTRFPPKTLNCEIPCKHEGVSQVFLQELPLLLSASGAPETDTSDGLEVT